jgi:hypothetical protein
VLAPGGSETGPYRRVKMPASGCAAIGRNVTRRSVAPASRRLFAFRFATFRRLQLPLRAARAGLRPAPTKSFGDSASRRHIICSGDFAQDHFGQVKFLRTIAKPKRLTLANLDDCGAFSPALVCGAISESLRDCRRVRPPGHPTL